MIFNCNFLNSFKNMGDTKQGEKHSLIYRVQRRLIRAYTVCKDKIVQTFRVNTVLSCCIVSFLPWYDFIAPAFHNFVADIYLNR